MNKEEWINTLKRLATTSKDFTGDMLIALDELLKNSVFVYNHASFVTSGADGRALLAELEEARARKAFHDLKKRLRQQKYIEVSKEGDRIIGLTHIGQTRALEARMGEKTELLPDDWYCVAAFDIPEDINKTRQQIRRKFRHLGLQCYQRSVWITKTNILEELTEYIRLIGAENWITVFKATSKNFRLK